MNLYSLTQTSISIRKSQQSHLKRQPDSELTALERGMHALHSGMDVKADALSLGRKQQTVSDEEDGGAGEAASR